MVDGPDEETEIVVRSYRDERVRMLALEEHVGGSEARNIGVRATRGEWVAFLDDDDLWLPTKLEQQIKTAAAMRVPHPIVSSRLLTSGLKVEQVFPRRSYTREENVSEYLFCRKGFAYGDGMLQTSTLLIKRALLLEIPFQRGLGQHQDWDWLLKVGWHPDVAIAMVPEPLTVMKVNEDAMSVSRRADWRTSLNWARENRWLMTPKAFAFFIATECVPRARREGASIFVFLCLLAESFWNGRVVFRQLFLFFCFCAIPERQRRELRDRTIHKVIPVENGAFR